MPSHFFKFIPALGFIIFTLLFTLNLTGCGSKVSHSDNTVVEEPPSEQITPKTIPTNHENNVKTPEALDNTHITIDANNTASNLTDATTEKVTVPESQEPTSVIPFKTAKQQALEVEKVKRFCDEIANKLRTVKYDGCMKLGLQTTDHYNSVQGRNLTYRHFTPNTNDDKTPAGKILFISGIHGDEYSAISITYLWMLNMLEHQKENQQHWLFLPLTNPDGLFRNPATRINANNVDLNRNFPSPDWDELAINYWVNHYRKNKRRYPGPSANSEPETQWLVDIIDEFKPDAIISVHAPYGLVDYDGPDHAVPNKIGALKHRELGTFPGSLGRYAGEYLEIPVLTLELRAAGTMPSNKEIYNMWQDVEEWTSTKVKGENPALPKSLTKSS